MLARKVTGLPVSAVVVTRPGRDPQERTLPSPGAEVALERTAEAGEVSVAAAARTWERPAPATTVSWFPAGPGPVAVADGAPDPQPTAAGIGEGSEAR